MSDTEQTENRETIRGLLTGQISEESDPRGWNDDVYMFTIVGAWRNDEAWLCQQMGNSTYPVRHRMVVAGWCMGSGRTTAFEALAASSQRYEDEHATLETLRETLSAPEMPGAVLGETVLRELVLVLEYRHPTAFYGVLQDTSFPLSHRLALLDFASRSATFKLAKVMRQDSEEE